MSSTDEASDSNELERAAGQIEAPLASLVGDYEESQSDSVSYTHLTLPTRLMV